MRRTYPRDNSHTSNHANATRNTRNSSGGFPKRLASYKSIGTILAALVLAVTLATGLIVVRGRAAGLRFPWSTSLTKMFASPGDGTLAPLVDLAGDYRSAATG